jgi:hypothetical protein
VAGDEGMEIVSGVKVSPIVIPSAHVRSGSRHALALPEWLQQGIFIEIEKQIVIVIELRAKGAIEELHLRIFKQR